MDQFEEKLKSCEVIELPYPHLIIKDVFSEDFYSELEKEIFNCKVTDYNPLGMFPNRKNFTDTLEEGVFGRKALDFLMSYQITKLFLNKFNNIRKKNTSYSLVKFQRSIAPYEISPHCDATQKLVTYMIYMQTEASPTDM